MNTQFEFLKVDDRRKNFYGGLVDAYDLVLRRCKKLKKGDARTATVLGFFFNLVQWKEGIGLHAFVDVVDCFAQVDDEEYSLVMPAPVHQLMDMIPPTLRLPGTLVLPPVIFPCVAHLKPQPYRKDPPLSADDLSSGSPDGWWFPPWKETFIKVMAQFEARYGFGFRQALTTRVAEKRLFEFMEQADSRSLSEFIESRYEFYRGLVDRYSKVLMPCKKKPDACTDAFLEGFFGCVERLQQEQEEGVGMATVGSQGFVGVVDCLAQVHTPPSPPLAVISPPPTPALPEEPEPKRQKFDETALVPQDQFLAQRSSGSCTIRLFVPDVGEVVIRR